MGFLSLHRRFKRNPYSDMTIRLKTLAKLRPSIVKSMRFGKNGIKDQFDKQREVGLHSKRKWKRSKRAIAEGNKTMERPGSYNEPRLGQGSGGAYKRAWLGKHGTFSRSRRLKKGISIKVGVNPAVFPRFFVVQGKNSRGASETWYGWGGRKKGVVIAARPISVNHDMTARAALSALNYVKSGKIPS